MAVSGWASRWAGRVLRVVRRPSEGLTVNRGCVAGVRRRICRGFLPHLGTPVALASESVTSSSDGNCNNWYPHGWSFTQWSGYPSGSTAWVEGDLKHNGVLKKTSYQAQYGASGRVAADNYYSTYSFGTGQWVEVGTHSGTVYNGQYINTYAYINCGT